MGSLSAKKCCVNVEELLWQVRTTLQHAGCTEKIDAAQWLALARNTQPGILRGATPNVDTDDARGDGRMKP
jgi:hypothetical protein